MLTTMKKYFMLLALAVAAIACQPEKQVTPTITLASNAAVTIPTDGAIETVSFNSNVVWTASIDNPMWNISAKSGEAGDVSIKVTAPENKTNDNVVATLTIKAESAEQKIVFTQLQKDAFIVDGTVKEIDAAAQEFTVSIKSNVEYSAEVNCDWITVASGYTKAMADYTAKVSVAANDGAAREAVITFKGAGEVIEFAVKQAAFVPKFEIAGKDANEDGNYYYEVAIAGGNFEFTVDTNIDYTVTTYDDTFTYQHVTRNGNNYSVSIDANNSYNGRHSYIKFVMPGVDEEGAPVDVAVRVYFFQAAEDCHAYSISMYDMSFDTWGTTVLSEAIYNGKHLVSNGQDLYEINPADGSYSKIEWFCGQGMTQKSITNDDAGNLIICNHTEYDTEAGYLDGNFMINVVTPAGVEKNLFTIPGWMVGGPIGTKLSVTGDVTGTALMAAAIESIDGVAFSNRMCYCEIRNGVAGEPVINTVSGFHGLSWLDGYWGVGPATPTIIAKTTSASDGFIMAGVYDENHLYSVDATGAATLLLDGSYYIDIYDCSGNVSNASLDIRTIGGKSYLVVLTSPHFPSYGPGWCGAPMVTVYDLAKLTPGMELFNDSSFTEIAESYFPYDADPAWDWAISIASCVKAYDADGKLGVAFVDLNGRSLGGYVFDPALL